MTGQDGHKNAEMEEQMRPQRDLRISNPIERGDP